MRITDGSNTEKRDALSRFTADILGFRDIGPGAGRSVNEEQFWDKVGPTSDLKWAVGAVAEPRGQVQARRYLFLVGQLVSLGVEVFIARDRIGAAWSPSSILISFVRISVSVYAVVLAQSYSRTRTVSTHTRLTHHLFALAAFSVFKAHFFTLGQYLSFSYRADVTTAEYASLVLAIMQTAQAGSIPLRPGEFQDLRYMYSTGVTDALAKAPQDENQPNVTPERSACIFSILTHAWAFSAIHKAILTDQLDVQDLAVLPPDVRTHNIALQTMEPSSPALRDSRFGPTAAVLWTIWSSESAAVLQGESSA